MRARRICWRQRRTIANVQRGRLRGGKLALESQETVSNRAERGVVVEAAPCAAFEMVEPDLALHLLVVALDAPSKFRETDQLVLASGARRVADVVAILLLR